MKKLWWLLLLPSCGQPTAEQHQTSPPGVLRVIHKPLAALPRPATPYTSGDRQTTGPFDTLHIGQGIVLRLVPGSSSDFANVPRPQLPFSEARLIRQQGDGRVRRTGHTLLVRPFAGPVLHFADDTYQIRKDNDEGRDTRCVFSGSIPGRPYWIVDSLQWERDQTFLVNKYSGRTTLLPYAPDISPNKHLLFIATPGLEAEGEGGGPNGLTLLTINDQVVKVVWTRTLQNWQPQRAHWLDNHTIAIEQGGLDSLGRETYVRLLLPN